MDAPTSLIHYPELCELEFTELYTTQMHIATISSIASVNIWKITLSSYSSDTTLHAFLNHHCWTSLDDCISALADKLRKLGNEQTLEVEFRIKYLIIDKPVDYKMFLPKFREKGRVRVVGRSDTRVLELVVGYILIRLLLSFLTRISVNCSSGLDA